MITIVVRRIVLSRAVMNYFSLLKSAIMIKNNSVHTYAHVTALEGKELD